MSEAAQPAVIAIVGPTASGKSALALRVAQAMDAEIVGTDSMQAYRGMNIGTAKPNEADQRLVRHHMIDVWPVDQAVSVVEFRDRARQAIDDVQERGTTALVVGGSGLYVRAVLEKLDFPGTDADVRARWEARLSEVGAPALHDELRARDPDAAQAIERNNGRRIVRATSTIASPDQSRSRSMGRRTRVARGASTYVGSVVGTADHSSPFRSPSQGSQDRKSSIAAAIWASRARLLVGRVPRDRG